MPSLYNNLDIIGFRSMDKGDKNDFQRKFFTYVSFFLLAIYLENHFKYQQKVSEGEDLFTNQQYKKLFEWDSAHSDAGKDLMQKFIRGAKLELETLNSNSGLLLNEAFHKKEEDDANYKGIFVIKKKYKQEDLINLYENLRFTTPFVVYRFMKFWPIMDFICLYGHFLNNLIIIYVAIYYNVNFVMFVNICCMCIFYLLTTIKMNNTANRLALECSLQTQCDLRLASIVSKKYKEETFRNFLNLRNSIWRF
jgi:hypothetical protein